ncbi:MAG: Dph6-related ATP pyrophosphatase [Planctomycetota bacterium]
MSKPKALVCWSSGKDAAWALHRVRVENCVDVVGLLTTVTEKYGRVSMHGVREEVLEAQARAAGLPLFKVNIPAPCPHELYEDKMGRAMREALEGGVSRVVFGDLHLRDIREYREAQLARVGMQAIFPLWDLPTGKLARDMIRGGLRARLTCLDPRQVPVELAGAEFDRKLLEKLPATVDPCGENGEFHTCCLDGPMFEKPVCAEVGETVERDGFVFTDLELSRTASVGQT